MRNPDQSSVENAGVAQERMAERIKAAIDALPKKANATAAGQRLAFLRLLDTIERLQRLDQPKFRSVSQKAINEELDELARRATALKSQTDEMHSGALYEIERSVPFINSTEFHEALRLIADAVGK